MTHFQISNNLTASVESYRKSLGGKWYQDVYFKLDGKAISVRVGTFKCDTPDEAKDKAIKLLSKLIENL